MKTFLPCLFLALALPAFPARAAEGLTISALKIAGEAPVPAVPVLSVFAAESATVDLAVAAPLGSRVTLVADVFQIAGRISAKLSEGVPLGDALDFTTQTHRIVPVKIPLPKIERPIELLVRVRAVPADPKAAPMGQFRLLVSQPGGFPEFQAAFASGQELRVFGPSKSLRAFLSALKVDYFDEGENLPETFRRGTLYVGEGASEEVLSRLKHEPAARVVFFTSGEIGGVFRTVTPTGVITKVTLPILHNLESNPASQRIFTDALLQSVPSHP